MNNLINKVVKRLGFEYDNEPSNSGADTSNQETKLSPSPLNEQDHDKNDRYDDYVLFANHVEDMNKEADGDKVYLTLDGDNVGSEVEDSLMHDETETAKQLSAKIRASHNLIEAEVAKVEGEVIFDGGDNMMILVSESAADKLADEVKRIYKDTTNHTVTIGIGKRPIEAHKALVLGKNTGKNKVIKWSPESEKQVEEIKRKQKELQPQYEQLKYKAANETEAGRPSSFGDGYWIDPSGQEFKVDTDHHDWAKHHKALLEKDYNLIGDESKLVFDMLREGWVRVSVKPKELDLTISDLMSPPDVLQVAADKYFNGNPIVVSDLATEFVQLMGPEDIREQVARPMQMAATLKTADDQARKWIVDFFDAEGDGELISMKHFQDEAMRASKEKKIPYDSIMDTLESLIEKKRIIVTDDFLELRGALQIKSFLQRHAAPPPVEVYQQHQMSPMGFTEMMQFYDEAPEDAQQELEQLLDSGDDEAAWALLEKYIGRRHLKYAFEYKGVQILLDPAVDKWCIASGDTILKERFDDYKAAEEFIDKYPGYFVEDDPTKTADSEIVKCPVCSVRYESQDLSDHLREEHNKKAAEEIIQAPEGKQFFSESGLKAIAHIRHENGKWVVYSHDYKKKLGTYETKEEAEKRLKQIEYFKHKGGTDMNKEAQVAPTLIGVKPKGDYYVAEVELPRSSTRHVDIRHLNEFLARWVKANGNELLPALQQQLNTSEELEFDPKQSEFFPNVTNDTVAFDVNFIMNPRVQVDEEAIEEEASSMPLPYPRISSELMQGRFNSSANRFELRAGKGPWKTVSSEIAARCEIEKIASVVEATNFMDEMKRKVDCLVDQVFKKADNVTNPQDVTTHKTEYETDRQYLGSPGNPQGPGVQAADDKLVPIYGVRKSTPIGYAKILNTYTEEDGSITAIVQYKDGHKGVAYKDNPSDAKWFEDEVAEPIEGKQAEVDAKDIKQVCATCGKFLGGNPEGKTLSHGVCDDPKCRAQWGVKESAIFPEDIRIGDTFRDLETGSVIEVVELLPGNMVKVKDSSGVATATKEYLLQKEYFEKQADDKLRVGDKVEWTEDLDPANPEVGPDLNIVDFEGVIQSIEGDTATVLPLVTPDPEAEKAMPGWFEMYEATNEPRKVKVKWLRKKADDRPPMPSAETAGPGMRWVWSEASGGWIQIPQGEDQGIVPVKTTADDIDESETFTDWEGSDEDLDDLYDIMENRQGSAVMEQFKSVVEGDALENQNPNALRYIAEFLEKRREDGAQEFAAAVREFLKKGSEGKKTAYDTVEAEEELDDYIQETYDQMQRRNKSIDPESASIEIAKAIYDDLRGTPALDYAENHIGNEFDIRHYIEEMLTDDEDEVEASKEKFTTCENCGGGGDVDGNICPGCEGEGELKEKAAIL